MGISIAFPLEGVEVFNLLAAVIADQIAQLEVDFLENLKIAQNCIRGSMLPKFNLHSRKA